MLTLNKIENYRKWKDHIERMDSNHIPKADLNYNTKGKKRQRKAGLRLRQIMFWIEASHDDDNDEYIFYCILFKYIFYYILFRYIFYSNISYIILYLNVFVII